MLNIYLDVKIDKNLSWQYHVNDLSIKLNRANALLFKIRKYVSLRILRSIYFAIFDSYLSYCCLVWDQNRGTIQQIVILQIRQLELIFNQEIPIAVPIQTKLHLKICLENILFVSKSLNTVSF